MKKIFWLVGEKSGDVHSAKVMEKLNLLSPEIQHVGIGGPLMQREGLKAIFPFDKFCIMGFVEIVKHLPFFLKIESYIRKYLIINKPDIVVLVDYPGLNFRIAKIAFQQHLKVFYFICPQFWAWKHYRVLKLKKYCHFVACILPFEKKLLDQYQISSSFVGHPVTEEIKFQMSKKEFAEKFNLDINKKWIGFLPGSRQNEVHRLLPIYRDTIDKLKKIKPEYQFLISKSNSVSGKMFTPRYPKPLRLSQKENPENIHFQNAGYTLIDEHTYEMMKYSDFLIVKSGTSTIEASCIGTPFAIVYKASHLSYLLAKKFIEIKHIGLPNIIFEKPIVPELIQNDVTPDKIVDTILFYMENEHKCRQMLSDFEELNKTLGQNSASTSVANLIKNIIME